jgi:hypothetical protein
VRAVGQRSEIDDLENVIVPDATCGLSLAFESRDDLLVFGEGGMHDLDRDSPLDANVYGFVNGTHATFADQAFDAVFVFENLTCLKRQRASNL